MKQGDEVGGLLQYFRSSGGSSLSTAQHLLVSLEGLDLADLALVFVSEGGNIDYLRERKSGWGAVDWLLTLEH